MAYSENIYEHIIVKKFSRKRFKMKVNDKFFSYDELKDAISRYGKGTLQCFVKRDSVTIDSWCKKLTYPIIVDEKVKSDLKYQKVIFKCIHYKKEEIKTKGNGVRAGKNC